LIGKILRLLIEGRIFHRLLIEGRIFHRPHQIPGKVLLILWEQMGKRNVFFSWILLTEHSGEMNPEHGVKPSKFRFSPPCCVRLQFWLFFAILNVLLPLGSGSLKKYCSNRVNEVFYPLRRSWCHFDSRSSI
jgi:hypothetical protein